MPPVPVLKSEYLVQKRNVLTDMRSDQDWTLQEMRFFAIYLSRINSRDVTTRVVRFPIIDFQAIMNLGSRVKIDHTKEVTNRLLSKIVHVELERGGYTAFQLFKECTVTQDDYGEWYMEIDAHDKALPLMFDFKDQYYSYRLTNVLSLKSTNQHHMYELLKRYEKIGTLVISVDELRLKLGLDADEYQRFNNFKTDVLEVCKKAMAEHTDIKFTYASEGKRGKHGKVLNLRFDIKGNKKHTEQISLDMYIDEQKHILTPDNEPSDDISLFGGRIEFFMEACNDEFSYTQIVTLNDKLRDILPSHDFTNQITCYHYLNDRYNAMVRQAEKGDVRSRFGYVKSLIGKPI